MTILTVSSKGQVIFPADICKRLGLKTGMRVEIIEEGDGVRLIVSRGANAANIAVSAGLVKAPSKGDARDLADFDPATTLRSSIGAPRGGFLP